jgi:hypothetical protein
VERIAQRQTADAYELAVWRDVAIDVDRALKTLRRCSPRQYFALQAAGVAGLVCGGLFGLVPWLYGRLSGQEVVDLRRAAVSPLFASTGRVEGASGAAGSANYAVRVGDPARWAAALASGLIAAGVCVSLRAIPGEPIVLGFELPATAAADELLNRANIPLIRDRPVRLVISHFGTAHAGALRPAS